MPVIGITGGAACGKSSFTDALEFFLPGAKRFCADSEVARLTSQDTVIKDSLRALLGELAYTSEGFYDRSFVRSRVFENPALRKEIEAVLHPPVRRAWTSLAEACRSDGTWLLAEIPLLFETGGEAECDRVVTVGCSLEIQFQRLTNVRGLSATLAQQICDAQTSLEQKSIRADHLIWNDCPFNCLKRQAGLCAAWLRLFFAR